MLIIGLLYSLILCGLGRGMLPGWIRFMNNHKLTDSNYAGERIPTAGGLLIWLLLLLHTLIVKAAFSLDGEGAFAVIQSEWNSSLLDELVLATSVVAFLGFLDDAAGDKTFKGFAGHWRLWKERGLISTGLVKAGGVSLASLLFIVQDSSVFQRPWKELGLPFLLVVLATNGINLLDTRPGRALKGFGSLFFLLIAAMLLGHSASWNTLAVLALPVLVSALILIGPDLRGKVMLGDTGANLLGFVYGCWVIQVTGWKVQLLLLTVFGILHGVTWRVSLTRIIDNNRVLSWLDWLGRGSRGSGPNKI